MKVYFTLIFWMSFIVTRGEQDIQIFHEKIEKGYILYARNTAYCPMTISLNLNLENLSLAEGDQKLFVIPEKSEKFKIVTLKILNTAKANKFSIEYHFSLGDALLTSYDTSYDYDLPFQKGMSFYILQGYNGDFSHQNLNALDFKMPEGTEILAAREGVVVRVVQNFTETCLREECKKLSNYVSIYHTDGSLATYGHIKYNGSAVKIGHVVKKGDLIAYSGNIGYSSTPHLHFDCTIADFQRRKTISTRFKINRGEKSDFLEGKQTYLKDY